MLFFGKSRMGKLSRRERKAYCEKCSNALWSEKNVLCGCKFDPHPCEAAGVSEERSVTVQKIIKALRDECTDDCTICPMRTENERDCRDYLDYCASYTLEWLAAELTDMPPDGRLKVIIGEKTRSLK